LLREPGGVQAAENIRGLVKDPSARISARAEALLYAAARAQLVEEALEPLLARGTWVLLDRFVDSSLAYQGAGRQLGLDAVRTINAFATAGLTPDRTLLLRIDPATGRRRSHGRGALDRLELESHEFFSRIAAAYDELARGEPDRIRVIDADRPPTEVVSAALRELADLV
jgi:dTMP kinase